MYLHYTQVEEGEGYVISWKVRWDIYIYIYIPFSIYLLCPYLFKYMYMYAY